MLIKFKLIQGVGNFTKTAAGGVDLSKVAVIYGENRNGKSTICDILHSLSENDSSVLLNRKSIPNDQTKPPKVELMFRTQAGNVDAIFQNEEWQDRYPECSRIYVFDQSFIHRNVITGQKLERSNSESMTSFILGENSAALYAALAEMNSNLREERRLLSNIESQLNTHAVGNVANYISSPLPLESSEQLKLKKTEYETTKLHITATINNIDKIRQRNVLSAVGVQVNFTQVCDSINAVLATNVQIIHQSSLLSLQAHIANHVNNPAAFKGWANQGVNQVKDTCPFCGQDLAPDAQNLIASYQQAFNEEFERFNEKTRQTLNGLRQPFRIPSTRETIIQQHQANVQLCQLYVEPQITNNPSFSSLSSTLNEKYNAIISSFDALHTNSQQATDFWAPRLESKYATPYEPAEQVRFDALNHSAATYNQAVYDYSVVTEELNTIFNAYKDTLNEAQLNRQLMATTQQLNQLDLKLKRISLEPLCIQYRGKQATINGLLSSYNSKKGQLDQSQTLYLHTYFNTVNQIFRQLGSSDFEIIKAQNNRGRNVVYDLRVKFKGEEIPPDKISTVFSESDRRALALCIFLAKIASLPPEEQSKAILIMDDPVTSFDNERIELILIKLDELHRLVKQLIITTHYKGMAAKTAKKFRHCANAIRLVNGNDTCEIHSVELKDMIATDHDLAFDKIKAFVERETHEDLRTSLRPFLESEIRSRFKKPLIESGKTPLSDLSPCVEVLTTNGNIRPDIAARLSSIINSLNTPMHEIGGDPIENARSLAEQILNIVYNEL